MPVRDDGQRIHLRREPSLEAKLQAFTFQTEALEAIRDLPYSAVFVEQGLGKSKIAADLILHWLDTRTIDTAVFVTKKSLIANTADEFHKHTHLRPLVLSDDRSRNYFVFNSPSRLVLAHYEVLRLENERIQMFARSRSVALILDESAKIKNPDSAITKAAFALAPLAKRRVVMTGTPVANRPYDIWAQIWFLDQGKSLGNDYTRFRQEYDLSNELADDEVRRGDLERLLLTVFERISPFTVRKTKGENTIQLPDKVVSNSYCDWEPRQRELYHAVRNEERAIVVRGGMPTEDDAEVVLKRLLRLVQVASNPSLVDQSYRARPGKLDVLEDVLTRVASSGEKCIVWTSFTENAEWLQREVSTFGSRALHGKMTIEMRERALNAFRTSDECRVLVATPGAAKEGLTLTVANHVVFWDRSFSLDDYLQAQDRIHRISQTRTCHVHNLVMRDSIDEWVDVLLQAKRLAAQLAQRDISFESYQAQMRYDFGTMIRSILGES